MMVHYANSCCIAVCTGLLAACALQVILFILVQHGYGQSDDCHDAAIVEHCSGFTIYALLTLTNSWSQASKSIMIHGTQKKLFRFTYCNYRSI